MNWIQSCTPFASNEINVSNQKPQSEGLRYIHDRFIGDDPERIASYEKALADARVATSVYELRIKAGLSRRELAARVGTTASVIGRLEDADYRGHSLTMLHRIAAAVGQRMVITFEPVE